MRVVRTLLVSIRKYIPYEPIHSCSLKFKNLLNVKFYIKMYS